MHARNMTSAVLNHAQSQDSPDGPVTIPSMLDPVIQVVVDDSSEANDGPDAWEGVPFIACPFSLAPASLCRTTQMQPAEQNT